MVVTVVLATQRRCLPESQSLIRVEMDIPPRNELCADVNISGGNEGTLSLLVLCGTRLRVYVSHLRGGEEG